MKVLLFNGSSRAAGCTYTALSIVAKALNEEGIETEIVQIGAKPVRDCIGCGQCKDKGKCVFDDDIVNGWIDMAMDRAFYAGGYAFTHKPAAVIASARRAGTTASLDAISKHLSISQMPVISSTYWNMAHGNTPEQVMQDAEGVETMHNLGKNLAWILKCIQAGKQVGIDIPATVHAERTNFIR